MYKIIAKHDGPFVNQKKIFIEYWPLYLKIQLYYIMKWYKNKLSFQLKN